VSGRRHAPAALYPRGKDPGTHCTGGWVGPRASLDTEVRGKISCLCRGSNPDRPIVQSVARQFNGSSYCKLDHITIWRHYCELQRIKKVRSTGSLLGNKSASERRVLTEEKPEEKQKSLRSPAQKTVSRNRKQP
jgi:hypothetical protein